jgi:hypothetical protein
VRYPFVLLKNSPIPNFQWIAKSGPSASSRVVNSRQLEPFVSTLWPEPSSSSSTFCGSLSTVQVHLQNFLLMANSCKDCAYTTCAQLHTHVARECKLSDGNPCQECVQLAKLDSQISKVHSKLAKLAQKRHALKTKINQRHEPFIHCLPRSVSSQIFADYVHQVHDTFDPRKHPIRIYK